MTYAGALILSVHIKQALLQCICNTFSSGYISLVLLSSPHNNHHNIHSANTTTCVMYNREVLAVMMYTW